MADTGLFIGVHGAGIVNAMLMPAGGVVVEIYPFAPLGCHYREPILRAGAAHYIQWCGTAGDCPRHADRSWDDGAILEFYENPGPYPQAEVPVPVSLNLRNAKLIFSRSLSTLTDYVTAFYYSSRA